MFLTRLGFGSKIVVTGDITQIDLPGGTRSGLKVVREILADVETCSSRISRALTSCGIGWSARSSTPTPGGTSVTRAAGRARRPIGRDPAAERRREHRGQQRVRRRGRRGRSGRARPVRARRDVGSIRLAELSIVLLDADAMAALHQQWMDLPGPTDVMAFPMDGWRSSRPSAPDPAARRAPTPTEPGALLGDVVLCPEVAAEQARHAGHSTESELRLLCTHGILHLLGYDHGEPEEEREMFELQARLVGDWAARPGVHRSGRRGRAPKAKSATSPPAPGPVSAMADPDHPRHGSSP